MRGRLPEGGPNWRTLASFLPSDLRSGIYRRSAVAATLSATLELAKSGRIRLKQDAAFGPLLLRAVPEGVWTEEERGVDGDDAPRSEEHTSELQSLMRISYAVFCLKKK